MSDLFKEIIPSILQTKKVCIVSEEDEKTYVPFVVNKALSFHLDCIMWANEMNMRPQIEKKLQYDYLFNIVRGYKRPFQKWYKQEKEDNIELLKEFYGYSTAKAAAALAILSADQLDIIRVALDKGGVKK